MFTCVFIAMTISALAMGIYLVPSKNVDVQENKILIKIRISQSPVTEAVKGT